MTTNMDLRYGFTIKLQNTLSDTLATNNFKTCQFYIKDQVITPNDKIQSEKLCVDRDLSFYIHTSVLCNFAHEVRPSIRWKAVRTVQDNLNTLSGLPAAAVLHVGKVGPLSNVIESANTLEVPFGTGRVGATLLFENAAGQGSELGANWDEMRRLFEGIDYVEGRIGICLDTQHMFAAGMCDFEDERSVQRMLDHAEGHYLMFHLNDSMKWYNSNVDRHAPLGNGYIWNNSTPGKLGGLDYLFTHCAENQIDMICETPNPNIDNAVIKNWMNGYIKRPAPQLTIF